MLNREWEMEMEHGDAHVANVEGPKPTCKQALFCRFAYHYLLAHAFALFCVCVFLARDPALAGGDVRLTDTWLWVVVTPAAHSEGRGLCLGQMARSPRATHTTQLARHTTITASRGSHCVVTTNFNLDRRSLERPVETGGAWGSNPLN